MAHHVLEYFTYGIDSFILCAGLAPAWHRKRAWLFLAVSFGLADGAASFTGHIVGQEWVASSSLLSIISPPLVAVYGVLVLTAAKRSRLIAIGPLGIVALALLSSLDNFVSGAIDVNAAHFPFEQAMTISFVTAVMALAGCFMGERLLEHWSIPPRTFAGSAAVATALIMNMT
jgi:putative Mn2+ efflux pump MntP